MTDMDKKLFAALVTTVDTGKLDGAMWLVSCGLGTIEDQWDDFQDVFEELFGVSWKEAEKFAKEFFDK